MSKPSDDLRSTEESIRRDAEQVESLEDEKAALDPADPQVPQLSERIEELATGLQGKAAAERELSEEIQATG
jgi:hypothetical protein